MNCLDDQIKQRQIRVFISSTFRDMNVEREELVKRVFPQLRRLCEQRGVIWVDVDLRWGVTNEQKAEGKVLPICLEEIKRCRPYFIGILGERYGWVPQEIPEELVEQEPWLSQYHQHSVTELEIIHGVLRDSTIHGHAFFYFRDPGYVNRLPSGSSEADFECESPEAKTRLDRLKEKIHHAQAEKVCALRENFRDPRELGQWILDDFTNLIDRLFPDGSQLDPLDHDTLDHEMFALSRARVYIGRQEYFARLDEHVTAKTQQPLLVTGESGSGKSALLANWAFRYRQSHPDDLLLMHFIGATPYSADWAAMTKRIMAELKRRFDLPGDIPDEADELRNAFASWLHMAATKGRVVLILDALNQLEDLDGALDLVWLPSVTPENVRLFVSTLPGRPLNELNKRRLVPLEIQPLAFDERREYVQKYLSQYSKSLSEDRLDRIAQAPQAKNPLFLKALLEELRLFGSHERLGQWIERYLSAQNVQELYEKILARWEQDYEGDTDLVGDALSVIWASRRGLSEKELMEILGKDGQPLPHATWSPLFLASGDALVNRSGLITFFHDYLRNAVRDAYVPTEEHQKKEHLRVAEYFEGKEIGPRKIDEMPWQLAQAKAWKRLYLLMADLQFLQAAAQRNLYDCRAYWARVEENSSLKGVDAYKPVIATPDKYGDYLFVVTEVLRYLGNPAEALSLYDYMERYSRVSGLGYQANLAYALYNEAIILVGKGELGQAMLKLEEAEQIFLGLGLKEDLRAVLNGKASIYYTQGDLNMAMKLYKENEELCRKEGDKSRLSVSLSNQALICRDRCDYSKVMPLLNEAEALSRELGQKDRVTNIRNQRAINLEHQGDLSGAIALYKEDEIICRELGNKDELIYSLMNQGNVLCQQSDFAGGIKLYKEAERLCLELDDKARLQHVFVLQGNALKGAGDFNGAIKLFKESENICRKKEFKPQLAKVLLSQAEILGPQGDLDGAMKLSKECERLASELDDKTILGPALTIQGTILGIRDDFEGALKLLNRSEPIYRQIGDQDCLQNVLNNIGNTLKGLGDLDGALKKYKESESICRATRNAEGLKQSLSNQSTIANATGKH
jgi:tetratricopeptide (TPR) repeat protein